MCSFAATQQERDSSLHFPFFLGQIRSHVYAWGGVAGGKGDQGNADAVWLRKIRVPGIGEGVNFNPAAWQRDLIPE